MTADHPTRSPDSPDPRGNAAIEAIGRIQRAIHMKGREASDGILVTADLIVQEAREAIQDFHNAPPRSPDSVRTPDLDAILETAWLRVYVRAGELIWKRTQLTPAEAHGLAAEVYNLVSLAALHPASSSDETPATGGEG
jgi:hypothetical protein